MLTRIVLILLVAVAGCAESAKPQSADAPNSTPTSDKPRAEAKEPAATSASHEFNGPHEVFFAGRLTVDVMEMMAPQRATELAQRLQQAARENPEWWPEHVKKAKRGEPLPYDSRLGLSKAEYDEFLTLSKQMVAQRKSETTLAITVTEDGVYVLDGGEALSDLTGIEIDLKMDVVRTPFGDAKKRSEINAKDGSPLGAWNGVQWKLEAPDANGMTGTVVKLAVGKLESSGRAVLYYDVRKIGRDGKTRISHVLNYDLPAKQ